VQDKKISVRQKIYNLIKERLDIARALKEPRPHVLFYDLNHGSTIGHQNKHLKQLNAAVSNNTLTSILEWEGPSTKLLRLSVEDDTGWVRTWAEETKKNMRACMVEVVIQDVNFGFIRSADRFVVSDIRYDTWKRNVGGYDDDRLNLSVIDFDIEKNVAIDDNDYLEKLLAEKSTVDVEVLQSAPYELVRDFVLFCKEKNIPINHLFQIRNALERLDIQDELQEIIRKHKGEM